MSYIAKHTKTVEIVGGKGEVRYELHRHTTYFSIKVFRDWKGGGPEVRVGQPKYIAKLWREMTGRVAPI